MRVMCQGLYRAYATNPHDVQAATKVMHPVSFQVPASRVALTHIVKKWLLNDTCQKRKTCNS